MVGRDVPVAPLLSLCNWSARSVASAHCPMKPLAILMFFAGLVSLPSDAQSEENASPLITALSSTTIGGYVNSSVWWARGTPRPPAGAPFNSYLYTSSGWQAHGCWWSQQFHTPNRHGFGNQGVYARCPHGIIYLPARPLRPPSGVFPGPNPPLPPPPLPGRTPGTSGTNQIPIRVIRQPTVPVSSGMISVEAYRIPSGYIPPVPPYRSIPPLPPTLNTSPPQ